jgi:hypothetical protein
VRKKRIVKIRRASGHEGTWLLHSITLKVDENMEKQDILELCSLDGTHGTTAYPEEVVSSIALEAPLTFDWRHEWKYGDRVTLVLKAIGR